MKKIILAASFVFISTAPALAAPQTGLMVTASHGSESATSIGKTAYYSKGFNIVLFNLGKEKIDLSKGCFKGLDPAGHEYKTDTIDAALSTGIVEPKGTKKGIIEFASDRADVYGVKLVRFQENCSQ